ncbi:MAG TPA: LamG domain-containing protein [Flavobacteriaceae bacterium]|nr:LamG domain-containing protein [Flavobacteriaceae bacterium]
MKNIFKYTIGIFALLIVSCNDGIDPITAVDPGSDGGAPSVTVMKPADGTVIDELSIESSIDIEFAVEDDIEIQLITVSWDGIQIASYDNFTDYRIFGDAFTKDDVSFGDHILSVTATDISGNTFTVSHTISKPPYEAMFASEEFYMPFDGNYTEFIGISNAGEVGTPGFFGNGFIGSNSFVAGADSYLTYPMGDMLGSSFSAMFWYRVVPGPDNRAGILVMGADENRTQGFRLFREGGSSSQTIKLNVGTGSGESWNNGGSVTVNGDWINVAFTVSPTETVVYLNGAPVNTATPSGPIDWTGCNDLVIGSGGPTFSYWGHKSDDSAMDELRFFTSALSQNEIQDIINATNPYEPIYDGEIVYMPFEGSFTDVVNNIDPTEVGDPTFAGTSHGGVNAYKGVTDSYLTYPLDDILNTEFSATMWYKLNAEPNRAGILSIRRPMDGGNHDLTHGFTFFREAAGDNQRFKLNVGTGGAGNWVDGGSDADVPANTTDWVHLAFSISGSKATVYINGEVAKEVDIPGPIDWTDCNVFSIMSGAPNFLQWNHWSDESSLDDLRIYNKALSQAEVQATME